MLRQLFGADDAADLLARGDAGSFFFLVIGCFRCCLALLFCCCYFRVKAVVYHSAFALPASFWW
jgi:hypothetical protein